MESPPLPTPIPNSKKRVYSSTDSAFMDPDVIEIGPPVSRSTTSKSAKQKQVIQPEIIDIDIDDDTADVMIIDEKIDSSAKGKAVKIDCAKGSSYQDKEVVPNHFLGPSNLAKLASVDGNQNSMSLAAGMHNSINLDDHGSDLSYDDELFDMSYDDMIFEDEYARLQAHFDHVDIPPGIEAPIPWWHGATVSKKNAAAGGSSHNSSSQANGNLLLDTPSHQFDQNKMKYISTPDSSFNTKTNSMSQPVSMELSSSQSKKELAQPKNLLHSSSFNNWGAANVPPSSDSSWFFDPFLGASTLAASSSFAHNYSSNLLKATSGVEQSSWTSFVPGSFNNQVGFPQNLTHQNLPMPPAHLALGVDSSSLWPQSSSVVKKKGSFKSALSYAGLFGQNPVHFIPEEETNITWLNNHDSCQKNPSAEGSSAVSSESLVEDDILMKFKLFKQFDTVEDHSDHHYTRQGSSLKQPPKSWAKRIQEEWKILERDLPDKIFVRVYEGRMDLLRAVIVGAEGTPYHDGLFFFDVFFPSNYPISPPLVHYHSGGLRLNPNLYHNGKVCLSLLNTWSGNKNEKWVPYMSTMLQVLVSIQALILNAKPFFNEPGCECMSGSKSGEKSSLQYNENTFLLSLKTMLYSMRRPPKHFEIFVAGHFYRHAHDILVACRAYMDGAQVGCLVKGGVQDVDEGDTACSNNFKLSLANYVVSLVKAFTQLGIKDCEKFLPPKNGRDEANSVTQAALTGKA
ncbi:Ubiquitin-conjugating enzyme E2 [Dillenia turbinata]|uniref:E2 ubiquitin-conjugating enzyme n=1 Tax=Dillenia turbinata TaxID=194707 RepID=A0AAN8ZTX5_9MAGN